MKRQTMKEINKKLKLGKAVKIAWGDAHGAHRLSYQAATELCEIHSYGVIAALTDETVTLAAFVNAEIWEETADDWSEKFRYIIVIPRKCVARVRLL